MAEHGKPLLIETIMRLVFERYHYVGKKQCKKTFTNVMSTMPDVEPIQTLQGSKRGLIVPASKVELQAVRLVARVMSYIEGILQWVKNKDQMKG
jgi:hypothetical protein